jgi:polar amino acid transport system substrate-binding protein
MRRTNRLMGFLALLLLVLNARAEPATQLNQLTIITEDYPPYNYLHEGQITGHAVALLLAASQLAGSPIQRADIDVKPWARGYHEVLNGSRSLLFSTSRSPAREHLFKWAGPIVEEHIALVAKKSRQFQVSSVAQLKTLRFGVVREDVSSHYLQPLGLAPSQIAQGNNVVSIARMLQADRIDIWPVAPDTANIILAKVNLNPDDYEVVAYLKSSALHYAFSKDVDDALVAQLQAALDQLRKTQPELFPTVNLDRLPLELPPIR